MSDSPREKHSPSLSSLSAPQQRKHNAQLQQLFARLTQEVEEKVPGNIIFFLVDFLCKHYPRHLSGFASVWNSDHELERDRLQVIEFFRFQKLPTEIASHFTNAGFDTLETLCTLSSESLDDIEKFNQTRWLPGHKVRLQQTFTDIAGRVRAYRQEREKMLHLARLTTGHCDHPAVITRSNAPHPALPATSVGPSPLPRIRALPALPNVSSVVAPQMAGVNLGYTASRPFAGTPTATHTSTVFPR